MLKREQTDGREFSKGSPEFDLTAMGKGAKESGLWTPGISLSQATCSYGVETESFLLSADVSRQRLWRGPSKVTSRLQSYFPTQDF